jgi:hypothetical protein
MLNMRRFAYLSYLTHRGFCSIVHTITECATDLAPYPLTWAWMRPDTYRLPYDTMCICSIPEDGLKSQLERSVCSPFEALLGLNLAFVVNVIGL